MNKIKNSVGETMAETLVALLITSLAMLMLSGSIVATSKVIKTVRDYKTALVMSPESDQRSESITVSICGGDITQKSDGSSSGISPIWYRTQDDNDNQYVYYAVKAAE